jgi:ATP-binding protein involved in chromosome partitioning
MPKLTEEAVMKALATVQEPELGGDLVSRGMIKDVSVEGTKVSLTVELTTPACPLKDEIQDRVEAALRAVGAEEIALTWGASVRRAAAPRPELLPGVRNIVAVASGKGGVGKSTVSVNLAVALAQAGASVGLLDADITGPNVPMMIGASGDPVATAEHKIVPLEAYGVKVISIQFFLAPDQPVVWRGPLVGGAITQFLRDVDWGELDYLVVDLPPGTSDAQLTLAQTVPITGAVLVTTPQQVAVSDVGRALAMFQKVNVPVLGIVENMAGFVCAHCGETTDIFGRGGGEELAAANGIDFLGSVPLDVTIRQGSDVGVPAVAQSEAGPAAVALAQIARAIAGKVSIQAALQEAAAQEAADAPGDPQLDGSGSLAQ